MTALLILSVLVADVCTIGVIVVFSRRLRRIEKHLDALAVSKAVGLPPHPYRSLPVFSEPAGREPARIVGPRLCIECAYFKYEFPNLRDGPQCTAKFCEDDGDVAFGSPAVLNKNNDCLVWKPASPKQLRERLAEG